MSIYMLPENDPALYNQAYDQYLAKVRELKSTAITRRSFDHEFFFGTNFRSDRFKPLMRNIRTGVLMASTHHAPDGTARERAHFTVTSANWQCVYCQVLVEVTLLGGTKVQVRCGEYFPINSRGCNLHPYRDNKEGPNEVFRKLKGEHQVAYGALVSSELLEEPRRELTQHERAVEEDALRSADLEEELEQNGVVDPALRFAQEKHAKKIRDKTNTQIRKSLKANLTAIGTIRARGPLSRDIEIMKKALKAAKEAADLEVVAEIAEAAREAELDEIVKEANSLLQQAKFTAKGNKSLVKGGKKAGKGFR